MERSFFSQPRSRRSSLVSPSSIKRRRSCHDRWAALAEARCCRWLRPSAAVVPSSAYLLRVLRPARTGVMYTLHMPITAGPELRTLWIRGPGSEISTACTAQELQALWARRLLPSRNSKWPMRGNASHFADKSPPCRTRTE